MIPDIRDVKPPVNPPLDLSEPLSWLWIIACVAIAVAGAWYLYYRRKNMAVAPIIAQRLPWDIALEQLEELLRQRYLDRGLYKPFYSTLSDIVRHYLENRFNMRAPEMTTEEFLIFVQHSPALTAGHKQALKDFLNGCDLVKFAKHEPSAHEAMANFDLAKKLIVDTSAKS